MEACVHLYDICHVQYKFFVDGQWRHDECQPHMSSEYGIVNTLFFPSDPNYNVGPGVAPGPNMDVDNQAFQNVVRFGSSLVYNIMLSPLLL